VSARRLALAGPKWDNGATTQTCRGAALTAPGVDTEGVIFHVG
jgi:hypothetical protein